MPVRTCCVPGCGNRTGIGHRLPKNPAAREVWLRRIGNATLFNQDETYLLNVRVCSVHFNPDCKCPSGRVRPMALPTLKLPGYVPMPDASDIFHLPEQQSVRGFKMPDMIKEGIKRIRESETVLGECPEISVRRIARVYGKRQLITAVDDEGPGIKVKRLSPEPGPSRTEMFPVISVLSAKTKLIPQLQRVLPGLTFHQVTNPDNDEHFNRSEILIADFDLLGPRLYQLSNVKWVQGTWAGAEKLLRYVRRDQFPNFPVTRFSGKHFGTLMSEYVVGNIINFERDFLRIRANQNKGEWKHEGKVFEHRTIPELCIGIMGLGTIGSKIGATLSYLGAEIIGLGRNTTFDPDRHPFVSRYFPVDHLSEFLSYPDYVVNVLPDTSQTRGMLNGTVLENCREKQAVLINIGRGTIVSEDVTVKALERKWIGGAILDVFQEEPLPKTSRLWTIPNVIITPHIAGVSRAKDIAEQFKINLELYRSNAPIPATIDFNRGY